MRNTFAEVLAELGREDSRICIVVADISPAGPMAEFRDRFPDRFINVGVAEQAMIGVCAGLALRGLRPFAYTIATFSLYRPFEFIRVDLAYQDLPVTVVGIGGGVVYSTLGGTHYAQEDIAVASAIPNMSIIAPCDPEETRAATAYAASRTSGGPLYLRLGKAGEPDLTAGAEEPFEFGKIRYLHRGSGGMAVISYGIMMKQATAVAERLVERFGDVSLISVPTLKPLDTHGLADVLAVHENVVVMEEHVPNGGLAAQVKALAWDSSARCRLSTFTLKDEFVHCYGSHEDLLRAHGISVDGIVASVNER